MRVVSKIGHYVSETIFKQMISLNKIEIHSFVLALVFLCLKSIFGMWLILTIFIGEDQILVPFMIDARNYFKLSLTDSTDTDFILTAMFTIINSLALFIYFHPIENEISEKFSRILLVLMLTFECFQYLGIVVISSNIENYILEGNYFWLVLDCVNLVLFFVLILTFKGFYFTISHGVKNILGRFPSTHNAMVETMSMILTVILTLIGCNNLNLAAKIIISLCFLILKALTINYSLRKWHYIDSNIQCIYSFLQVVETIALFFNLVLEITKEPLMGQNYYVCVFITASFFFFGWKNYFLHTQEALYFYKAKDLKLIPEVVLYFKVLFDLSGKGETKNDSPLILSSIRKQHEIHCINQRCYCKGAVEDLDFAKDYIIEQLDDIRLQFKNQPKILIQELNFRFKMFSTYPDVLTRLEKIQNYYTLGVIENFSIASLKKDLIEWMGERNRTANTIDIETPLKLGEITKEIEKIIEKDIQKKKNKWKYLSQGLCRTDELEEDTKAEIGFIKEINEIQHEWNTKMKRSTIFNFLLLYYYKKVSFLHVNVDQIFKNINETMKKIKEEELSSVKEFAKCLFHKRSCVIESPINEDNMGIVTRASKNVFDLFGYQPNKIIGINLNRLMPNFMMIEHDIILAEWVKNGTWRTVGKLKEIFCIHKDQYCFNALLYLKIIANEKGLFFMTVVFKKNESDYLILNCKKEIEGIGRKFLQVIGNNCRRLPVEVLFDNFPEQEIPKNFEYKTFTRTFRSFRNNEHLVDEFFEHKSLMIQRENSLNELIKEYKDRLNLSSNVERWEVKFDAKIYKMREVRYYVILLNHARLVAVEDNGSLSTIEHGKVENILVGHGKMNEDEDSSFDDSKKSSDSTVGENKTKFIDDKGSSVSSFAERESFTLTKLLSIFFSYLIHPEEIRDKRVNTLNLSTLLETLALTTIITFTFVTYNGNMNDIGQYISASADVNANIQRVILMYSRAISFEEYKNDKSTLVDILSGTLIDMSEFYESTRWEMHEIYEQVSGYSGERLYSYLYEPINWQYSIEHPSFHLKSFVFFEFYYYTTASIAMSIYTNLSINPNASINILQDMQYEITCIKNNFPELKSKTTIFTNNYLTLAQNSILNVNLIGSIMTGLFALITLIFFIYTCHYHRFRNDQKYECLHIYQTMPSQLIMRLKKYYHQLYNDFTNIQNKNSGIELDFQTFTQHELMLEGNIYSTNNTHIKFLGRRSFYGWIRPLVIFLSVNVINVIITYEVITFMQPLDQLIIDINNIINSENELFESYLELKSSYILSETPNITDTLIINVLNVVALNEVAFNHMVTFTSSTLTSYDSNFEKDFKSILVNNVCQEIQDELTDDQFSYCMNVSKTSMISEGIITFMNSLQRKLRSAAVDLQANLSLRYQSEGENYFINRGFTDVDLSMSFNIKVFKKLIERILSAYEKGIVYISILNYIIVGLLITPQVIALIFWFHLAMSEKVKISFLYGSILTIPPQIIKQVKNLPRLAKKILEFSET